MTNDDDIDDGEIEWLAEVLMRLEERCPVVADEELIRLANNMIIHRRDLVIRILIVAVVEATHTRGTA